MNIEILTKIVALTTLVCLASTVQASSNGFIKESDSEERTNPLETSQSNKASNGLDPSVDKLLSRLSGDGSRSNKLGIYSNSPNDPSEISTIPIHLPSFSGRASHITSISLFDETRPDAEVYQILARPIERRLSSGESESPEETTPTSE